MLHHYNILNEISRSANSRVFVAQRSIHGPKVILKGFRFDEQSDITLEEQLSRFRRECDIHLFLRHERIVPALESFEADGIPYLVTEYKPYPSLKTLLDERKPVSILQALNLVQQLCQALHYIHDLGIIHRDIKPQNILISDDNKLYLTDFGCARKVFAPNITQTRLLQGTLYYMSPEQMLGRSDLDFRADLFSAGVILYQLLSGSLPFEGKDLEDMVQNLLSQEPRSLIEQNPFVPPSLEKMVVNTLQKDPDYRTPTAKKLAYDIEQLLNDPNIYYSEAQWVMQQQGSHEAAKDFCLFALQRDSFHSPSLKMLGGLYQHLGQWDLARRCYERLLAREPGEATTYFELGKIEQQEGFYDSALKMYEHAWVLEPNNKTYQLQVAHMLHSLHRRHDAIEHYKTLAERHTDWSEPLYQLGLLYYDDDQKEAALEHFRKAYQLSPGSPGIVYNLAALFHELGYYHEALSMYQQLSQNGDQSIQTQHNLANLYYHMGELSKAREILEKMVESHNWPKSNEWEMTYRLMGFVYSRLSLHDEAIEAFKCTILSNFNHLDSYLYLAYAYRERLKLEDAINTLKYVASQPIGQDQASVYFLLARAYYEQGKEMESLSSLETCLSCHETLSRAMSEQARKDLAFLKERYHKKYNREQRIARFQRKQQNTSRPPLAMITPLHKSHHVV